MKFSIIIPVYNVDQALFDHCMSSILHEKETSYEIIIVDDGSDVSCANVCNQYAEAHSNVSVIHEENKGVSVARNCGIANALGEWVLFIDADDWIESNALKSIEKIAGQTDAEIIFFGYYKNFPNKELKITSATYKSGAEIVTEHEKTELQKKTIGASEYGETGARATIFRSVWSVAFKREMLLRASVLFPEGVPIGEDLIFRLYSSRYARKIQYSDYCYYHYRNNQGSASCMYRKTAEEDSLKELSEIKKFITSGNQNELKEAYQFRIVEIMTVLPSRCYFHKDNPHNYLKRRKQASLFMHSDTVRSVTLQTIRKLPLKRKIQNFLLKNSMFEIYMLIIKENKKIRGFD